MKKSLFSFNYRYNEKINFEPGVGIVHLDVSEVSFLPSIYETWELKSYRQ